MKVKSIHIYPVKGLQGISVTSAICTERGFEMDRRWMLIDEEGYFLSQRSHPELATYRTSMKDSTISVERNGSTLNFSPLDITNDIITAGMFEHKFPVHVASSEFNTWWSEQLGQSVRLVYLTDEDIRIKHYIGDGNQTEMSLADGYPYLVLGTASLAYLNERLAHPLTADRFRANIIIETEVPHVEDSWDYVLIGHNKIYVVKPCARCQVITVDQQSGEKGKEPLKTLASYRRKDKKVLFGANAISIGRDAINVSDEVQPL